MSNKISRRRFIAAASLGTAATVLVESKDLLGMVNRTPIIVDARKITGPLPHIWNGYLGNLCLTLNPLGASLLDRINETSTFPFYRRCWGITSSGTCNASKSYGSLNVYHEDSEGNPFYDFTLFDQVFDIIISKNIIPIMCIGFVPDLLSSAPSSGEKGGTYPPNDFEIYPPNDYDKWYDLVYAHSSFRYWSICIHNSSSSIWY